MKQIFTSWLLPLIILLMHSELGLAQSTYSNDYITFEYPSAFTVKDGKQDGSYQVTCALPDNSAALIIFLQPTHAIDSYNPFYFIDSLIDTIANSAQCDVKTGQKGKGTKIGLNGQYKFFTLENRAEKLSGFMFAGKNTKYGVVFLALAEDQTQLNQLNEITNSIKIVNKNLIIYWQSIFHGELNEQDIEYINQKYPSGFSTETIVLMGEYEDDVNITEVVPSESVITDVITHHYNDIGTYPTPAYIGEIFAKVYKEDYYRHVDLDSLWYAYQLCQDLIHDGRFNAFMQDLEKIDYPPIDINKLKHVTTQQDKQICEVMNACLYTLLGNGGLGIEYVFDGYYTFDY